MRPSADEYFLLMADLVSRRSTCYRRRVGCVLVDERRHVLSTGYNGVASYMPHCNEPTEVIYPNTDARDRVMEDLRTRRRPFNVMHRPDGKASLRIYHHACEGAGDLSGQRTGVCGAIHAEQNALLQCRDVYQIATCYVTVAPCLECVKLLLGTSCERVVFLESREASRPAEELWEASRGEGAWVWHREPLPLEIGVKEARTVV